MEESKGNEAMASANNPKNVGGSESDGSLTEGRPLHPPPISSAQELEMDQTGINAKVDESREHEHTSHPSQHVHVQFEHDQTITPGSEVSPYPLSVHTTTALWTSEDLNSLSRALPSQELRQGRSSISHRGDHVVPAALQNRNVAELSRPTSTSTLSSTSEANQLHGRRGSTSAPQSPERRPKVSRDFSTQTVVGPTSNPQPTRPTSVPSFQTQSPVRRRRDGPGYPTYPDQSFAALQSQHYPVPYQPHPLRTRSSHPSQGSSYSSSSSKSREYYVMPSGAKTAGNTPSQSPGLFTPTTSRNRNAGDDSEDSQYSTPLLHPSHLQAPKETHKLLKDFDPATGRKTVNNYAILRKLGSGQHGTVKLGKNLDTGEYVAVKIVRRFSKKLRLGKAGDPNDMIKKEVAILKKARHGNVVSLLEVIDDDEFGKVYLVLEYVVRGELAWRKQTDKEIAHFEMDRIKREKSGLLDQEHEIEEIRKFNAASPSRLAAKSRVLEEQRRHARAQLRAKDVQKHGYDVNTPFWSLEYATELEEEQACDSGTPEDPYPEEPEVTPMEYDMLGAREPSMERSALGDSDTPRAPSGLGVLAAFPTTPPSRSGSHPATPVSLEGSIHLPDRSDRHSHEVVFPSTIEQIIALQSQWTPEEEEFMYVPCLTVSQAFDAFRDTVLGLEYLHYQGIIHRDIKPANLLWTEDHRVKISDFGVSYLGKPIREDDNKEEIAEADADVLDEAIELAKTVGTPAFYAPELCDPELFDFNKNPERPLITGQIDVWALGITLYCMIFGRLPFFDVNEFAMYEKIAREDVFIPKLRLRGVEDTVKASMNHNKRPDHILEYEEIDEELSDLLRKLLNKQPAKRISLKEVKHHPWVLRRIGDQLAWEETDPSVQSQGKKIEVSTQEVQEAVVGLNFVDRIKSGIRRLGSVVARGRDSKKKEHSSPKPLDNPPHTSSPKGGVSGQDGRRPSLRSEEQIYNVLRASREGSEHPLSQSVAASPEIRVAQSYFDNDRDLTTSENCSADKPIFLERTLSNAESTKTIRASVPAMIQEIASSSGETFSPMTPVHDSNSSSFGGIFEGNRPRFNNTMRSRERGRGRESPSNSSRSSSIGTHSNALEDPHALPSLAISSAVASGHVDIPIALRDDLPPAESPLVEASPSTYFSRLPGASSAGAFEHPQEDNYRRRSLRHTGGISGRRRTIASIPDISCPPSPEDESLFRDQHHSSSHFGVSSSSDQITSGISEFTSHPSFPSIVSGASSISALADEYPSSLKEFSHPSTIVSRSPRSVFGADEMPDHFSTLNSGPTEDGTTVDDDEAGYNGEGESDSDSDDGIEMGGGRPK